MIWAILEGIGLGILLIIYCLIGISKGPVNMVFLYNKQVQLKSIELGLITPKKIKRNALIFKIVGIISYIAYCLIFVYLVNGARGFLPGFLQLLIILSICNLIDRILVDEIWVNHTKAWIIPGTEQYMPYIKTKDKIKKWIFGTVGMAAIAALLALIMMLFIK